MITLKSLVKAAAFDEETRATILDKIDKNELDVNQKFQMTELCWDMIFTLYESELKVRIDAMMTDTAEGRKLYEQKDYIEMKNKLFQKLTSQLEAESTEEAIAEVKKKLETYTRKPKSGTVR